MNPIRLVQVIVALAFVSSACVTHIRPYEPKSRNYELPVPHPVSADSGGNGSLFDPNGPGSRLLSDERAQGVNDLVVVVIDEQSSATQDTSTQTSREDEWEATMDKFLGLVERLNQDARMMTDSSSGALNGLSLASKNAFKGSGATARNDKVEATVPALVKQVLPNGNLFIEGHRVLLVNREENHFYISGVIRPRDIDGDGRVNSSRMADAQIELTGRGSLTSASEKGWFSSFLDVAWPF